MQQVGGGRGKPGNPPFHLQARVTPRCLASRLLPLSPGVKNAKTASGGERPLASRWVLCE